MKRYEKLIAEIESMQDDSDNEKLEKAVSAYCSMWHAREGMKLALVIALRDQYINHAEDQERGALGKIRKILKI